MREQAQELRYLLALHTASQFDLPNTRVPEHNYYDPKTLPSPNFLKPNLDESRQSAT